MADETQDNQVDITADMSQAEAAVYSGLQASFTSDPDSIPDKFKKATNPALEYLKSMKEAEKKISQQGQELADLKKPKQAEETTVTDEKTGEKIRTVDFDKPKPPSERSLAEIVQISAGREGKISNADRAYLKENHNMTDQDIDNVLEPGIRAAAQARTDAVLKVVGGEDGYRQLNAWITTNKTPEEIDAINAATSNPALRDDLLRGLVAQAALTEAMQPTAGPTQVRPTTSNSAEPGVKGFESNQELWEALAHPALKSNSHPDHAMMSAKIEARINATKPGILE